MTVCALHIMYFGVNDSNLSIKMKNSKYIINIRIYKRTANISFSAFAPRFALYIPFVRQATYIVGEYSNIYGLFMMTVRKCYNNHFICAWCDYQN